MNIPLLVIVLLAGLSLIIFLVVRNQKDKKDLVNKLNQDYKKSKDEEDETPGHDFPH